MGEPVKCRKDRCGDPVGGRRGWQIGDMTEPRDCRHPGKCCWHARKGCAMYVDTCDTHDISGCPDCYCGRQTPVGRTCTFPPDHVMFGIAHGEPA